MGEVNDSMNNRDSLPSLQEIEKGGTASVYTECKEIANNIVKYADTLTPTETKFVEKVNQTKPRFKRWTIGFFVYCLMKLLTLVVGFTTVALITATVSFTPYVADVFLTVCLMIMTRKTGKIVENELDYFEMDVSEIAVAYEEYVREQRELQRSEENQNQTILDQAKGSDTSATLDSKEPTILDFGTYDDDDRGKTFVRKIGK